MRLTSTDVPRVVRRRRRRRVRGAVLVAVVAAVAGLAVAWTGSSGSRPVALVSSVASERSDSEGLSAERASRSGSRTEEPVPPPAVTVTADGSARQVFVAAANVRDLLARVGITIDGDDEVTPPLDAAPGTTVTVARVDVRRVTEDRTIPTPKDRRDDPAMPRGETRVESDGSPGLERVVYQIVRRDGRVVARRQISAETVTPAKPRVVYVGRGDGRGAPADEVPLKLRIAQGAALDGAGQAGHRAASGGVQEGGASWYRYKPGTCAHRTLPKGTLVKVVNLASGKTATCTVADRGPFIAGRIIDLDHSVFMAIADSPGQGVVRVRIEW